MSGLSTQLARLYLLPDQPPPAQAAPGESLHQLKLLGPRQQVRTLVLEFPSGKDWPRIAGLWETLADTLTLPPPGLSISPDAGYQLWFSLAAPIPLQEAQRFAEGLRQRYLADLPESRLIVLPAPDQPSVPSVPAYHARQDKWSAFIDPDMGALFSDEPGLDAPPNPERQAEMLAGLNSISLDAFHAALAQLTAPATISRHAGLSPADNPSGLDSANRTYYDDPRSFLLAVMNDERVPIGERIKAATALLPLPKQGETP